MEVSHNNELAGSMQGKGMNVNIDKQNEKVSLYGDFEMHELVYFKKELEIALETINDLINQEEIGFNNHLYKQLIPHGDSCSSNKGICPYWKTINKNNEDEITRAQCLYLNFTEQKDFQSTFLWGMVKNCSVNK